MYSSSREEAVAAFDNLDTALNRVLKVSPDDLTIPECLAMLQRCEKIRRRLPAAEHPFINKLADQTDQTELGGKLPFALAERLHISRGEASRRIHEAADSDVDLVVYVTVEVVKPEDREAIAATRRPVVAVLNKADLAGPLSGAGPIVMAQARCAQFSTLLGVPMESMIGLLAVAALDDLDDTLRAVLRALAAHPDGFDALDRAVAGFLAAALPVPTEVRLRLLDTLDLFGIALGMAAFRPGRPSRTPAQLRTLLRRVSGVDAVIDKVTAAGSEVRYRRLLDAVAELEALAAQAKEIGGPIGEFLRDDDTVLARMAAAVDVALAVGLDVGPLDDPAAHLPRAVRWHRYSLDNGDMHRTCGADIARGSLRLWSLAGGMPLHRYRKSS